jgi:dethiobiotin synthetase
MRGITVLGTDTSVGKTIVSCSLLRVLSFRGWKPFPCKPVETGLSSGTPDSRILLDAAGFFSLPEETSSKFRYSEPVAPALASSMSGVAISKETLLSFTQKQNFGCNFSVVETAGGPLSPIFSTFTCLDLAVSLGYPVLLVTKNGLGTVSVTSLAVREILRNGVQLLGIVLNTTSKHRSPDQPFNASLIETMTGIRPLGVIPFLEAWPSMDLLSVGLEIFSENIIPLWSSERRSPLVEER